jgi:hypothetical protein
MFLPPILNIARYCKAKQLRIRTSRFYKLGPHIFGPRAGYSFSVQYGRRPSYMASSLPPAAEYMPQPQMQLNCRVHAPTANATELWCSHPVLLRSSALNSQPSGLIAPSPPPPARPPDVHLRVARCPSAVRCVIGTCFPDRAGTLDSLAQTKKHPKERRPAVAPTEGCSPVLRAMLFSSLGWEAGPPHTLVIPTDSEGAVRLRRSGGTPTDASFAMLLQGVQPTLFLFNRLQSRNDERTQGEGLRTLK